MNAGERLLIPLLPVFVLVSFAVLARDNAEAGKTEENGEVSSAVQPTGTEQTVPGDAHETDDEEDTDKDNSPMDTNKKGSISWGVGSNKYLISVTETEFSPLYDGSPLGPERAQSSGQDIRSLRYRIIIPQFNVLFAENLASLGIEAGFQIEILGSHIISILGEAGFWEQYTYGGGIGYSYEFELVRKILRLELGATFGYHWWPRVEMVKKYESVCVDSDCLETVPGMTEGPEVTGDRFGVVLLRPMLHVGYEYIFFSIGPRMIAGPDICGGVGAGLMIRI